MVSVLTILAFVLAYAMGWTQGNSRGQIKAHQEHLKFLRESSARADAEYTELRKMLVARDRYDHPTPKN